MFSGLVFRHASSAFTATRHSGRETKHNPSSLSLIFLTKRTHMPSSNHREAPCDPAYPQSFLLWPPHSCSRLRPSPLRPQPAKEAAVPVQTAATSSYSGNAKTRIFHVSGCRYFNCKALHGAFQIRGRGPQQRIPTPANAVWPARAK